ncbi:MAG: pilus assembly protein [Jiangellaceae bacterium]|nr:pilus assembly protein [Jiangellaceae bacterium]
MTEPQRGAAVVEFTLVSVLVVGLFLAIVQFGLAIHVRNTLIACAAEGARHAANADRSLFDGAARAQALISESLSPTIAADVTARYITSRGVQQVEIAVTATLPVFGLLGVERGLQVSGHAVEESAL